MRKYLVLMPIIALIFSTLACGTSNTGTKIGDATSVAPAASEGQQLQTYKVGDVVEVQDHRITLTGVNYSGGILKTNFLIENTGTKELNVSSILLFEAKDDNGTKLEQDIFCGSSVDGKVLAGDKLRGDICWKLSSPMNTKLYYKPNVLGSGAIVWEINTNSQTDNAETNPQAQPAIGGNEQAATTVPPEDNSLTGQVYQIGDVVEVEGQRITLVSAEVVNNILKANFLIENTGSSEFTISSILLFTAKNGDGTKLEQNIFDCGSSMIDGKVLAGDKIKGDICWNTGGSSEIKIYYTANLLGSGAVVWAIK
jgi:hypothetical protein